MAIFYNPRIVTDGLVLALDAANTKSYPGSGTTWTDLSGRGNTGTLTNGPTYNGANYGSIGFDGSNDYVSIGSQSIIGSGTSPFSVEVWFYFTKTLTSGQAVHIIDIKQDTQFFTSFYNPSGTLYAFSVFRGGTQWGIPVTQSDYLNKWICWTVVYNGGNKSTASSYATYSNGVQLPTGSVNFGAAGGSGTITQFGADGDGGSPYSQGNYASVKIYNRALSTAEVSQNYNALKGRYVSLDPYILLVSLLLRNSLTDESPLHKTITANGTVSISTTTVKYGTGSIAVNGNSGYLTTSSDASLGMGTGDFTVELWIYMTSAWSDSIGIFGFSSGHGVSNFGGTLSFWKNGGFYFYSSGTLPQNQWAHIALTRQGTTLKHFVDGTSIATVTFSEDLGSTASIDIGRHNNGYGKEVNGFIDDFRVTKGISRYNSNFTPPSVELPNY